MAIGRSSQFLHLGATGLYSEIAQSLIRPASTLAFHSLAQRCIRKKSVVLLQRRRLVGNRVGIEFSDRFSGCHGLFPRRGPVWSQAIQRRETASRSDIE
jgi:hypothetical protein